MNKKDKKRKGLIASAILTGTNALTGITGSIVNAFEQIPNDTISQQDLNQLDDVGLYTVEKGDTLYLISQRYNVPENDLIIANNLDDSVLSPGMKLEVLPSRVKNILKDYSKEQIIKKIFRKEYRDNIIDANRADNLIQTISPIQIINKDDNKPKATINQNIETNQINRINPNNIINEVPILVNKPNTIPNINPEVVETTQNSTPSEENTSNSEKNELETLNILEEVIDIKSETINTEEKIKPENVETIETSVINSNDEPIIGNKIEIIPDTIEIIPENVNPDNTIISNESDFIETLTTIEDNKNEIQPEKIETVIQPEIINNIEEISENTTTVKPENVELIEQPEINAPVIETQPVTGIESTIDEPNRTIIPDNVELVEQPNIEIPIVEETIINTDIEPTTINEDIEVTPINPIVENVIKEEPVTITSTTTKEVKTNVVKFETITIKDNTLDEDIVITESTGTDGYTLTKSEIIVYSNGETFEKVLEETVISPVNEVIRQGTKPKFIREMVSTEIVETKSNFVNPEEEKIEDDTLLIGETVVLEEGEQGYTITKSEKSTYNDDTIEENVIEETVVNPKPRKIKVGTKTPDIITEDVSTNIEEIKYDTITIEDPELNIGERYTEKGELGYKEVTIIKKLINGEVDSITSSEKIINEPKNEIIHIGAKEIILETEIHNVEIHEDETNEIIIENETLTENSTEETPIIPENNHFVEVHEDENTESVTEINNNSGTTKETFDNSGSTENHIIEIEENDDLNIEINENNLTEISNNHYVEIEKVENDLSINDLTTNSLNHEALIEDNEIVETSEEVKRNVDVEFNTTIVKDYTRKLGEPDIVTQDGEKGLIIETIKNNYVNGELITSNIISTETIREPKDRIISRAVGLEVMTTETVVRDIPITEEIRKDSTLKKGERIVIDEGEFGLKNVTFEFIHFNDVEVSRKIIKEEIFREPRNKIILEGTADTSIETTRKEYIKKPFDTITVESSEILTGERIVTEGSDGQIERTHYDTYIDGSLIETRYEDKVVTEPINKIITIGTGKSTFRNNFKEEVIENSEIEYVIEETTDLAPGQERIVKEGTKSVYVISLREEVFNGKIVETKEMSRAIKKGTKGIKQIGKAKSVAKETSFGYIDTDRTREGWNIRSTNIVVNENISTLDNETDSSKYNKAKDETYINEIVAHTPQGLLRIPTKLDPATIRKANNYEYINVNKLNEEFLKLLNNERQSKGLSTLNYSSKLQKGANDRSNEMANIGHIRVNNKPHVRPDGSSYRNAFTYLDYDVNMLGENILGNNFKGNPYELVSEKYLAELFFNQWKNSKGHYANMMNPDYKYSTISMAYGDKNQFSEDMYTSLIAVQILSL